MEEQRTAMPWIPPRKGFSWLPLSYQLVVWCGMALMALALLPALLEPTRMGSGNLKRAFLMPRTTVQAARRLEQHYGFGWLFEAPSSERKLWLIVVSVQTALISGGALAGPTARGQRAATPGAPLAFGGAGRVRARTSLLHETKR
jgi:hypothetical protein